MLTDAQLAEFDRTGIVKVEGVFTADEAARMRDVVWGELRQRYEIQRDDPSTWHRHPPNGMKNARKHRAFAPTRGRALTEVFDQLFGSGGWAQPKHYGQVLVTMPNAREWRVPSGLWHADFDYMSREVPLWAVKYWALFGEVAPGGGGTLQLAGSHRIAARYIAGKPRAELEYKRTRDRIMRSHPWLHALCTDDDDPGRNARFMAAEADIDGIPARVVELTGSPGDVYVTHPWVMHAIAPNASDQPRFMRSMAVTRGGRSAGDDVPRDEGAVVE